MALLFLALSAANASADLDDALALNQSDDVLALEESADGAVIDEYLDDSSSFAINSNSKSLSSSSNSKSLSSNSSSNSESLSSNSDSDILSAGSIYVDPVNGNDGNDGHSNSSSVKTLKRALSLASNNDNLYLSNGFFSGLNNTRLNLTKSINFFGSENTVIDGENANYLFIIQDGLSVSFSNIRFVNAYKSPRSYSINYDENIYGGALEIKNSTVIVDSCSFLNNRLYYDTSNKYIYGAAISSFGDLKITNSYFENNCAFSDSGLFSYGGCVYNNGKLIINHTVMNKSSSVDFGFGAGIANDGDAVLDFISIVASNATQECRGSAIYNRGRLRLTNSLILNNSIKRSNFNFIFGAVYNEGELTAYGNLFANNSANYNDTMPFKGSPTIYNVGDLNLTYNAFIDNLAHEGVASDLYFNGGELISADWNWWNTNSNPFDDYRINIDEVNAWMTFNIDPDYSKLNIGDTIEITAFFSSSTGVLHNIELFPLFNVSFNVDDISKELTNGNASFIFTHSQEKGSWNITATVFSFIASATVDIGKIYTDIVLDVASNITYQEDLNISIEVIGQDESLPQGNLSLIIQNEVHLVNLTDGKANLTISNLLPGEVLLTVIYNGNDDYFKSFENKAINVEKKFVNMNVSIPEIKIYQSAIVTASILTEGASGQARVYIDGAAKKIVYLSNGDTPISFSGFAEGDYNITIEFLETQFFHATNASAILKVRKYDSSFNISAEDIYYGQTAILKIIPTPSTLIGQATLIVNGYSTPINIYDPITLVNLESLYGGSYNVSLFFEGDGKYYPSNASCTFNVLKYDSSLDVAVVYDENTFKGSISVKALPKNCTGIVGVYVNFKEYRMTLKNGEAFFNVDYDKGTNYIFVYYEGDDYHYESSWNTTIGVADDFVLIGKDVSAYQFNDFYYSIRLLEPSGVPLPMRNVTIHFNGSSYNIITDENGFGDFKLNLDSGIYNISASYRNSTVNHTLTVRDIEFDLSANNVSYGDLEEFKASFENDISGTVNFIIDGILDVNADIVNKTASFNLTGLNAGNYTLKAIYRNGIFNSSEFATNFTIFKADLDYEIEINEITPEINPIIKLANLGNASGDMIFTFNETQYRREISNSESILTILDTFPTGKYTVFFNYAGDDNYNGFEGSTAFYVKDAFSMILLEIGNGTYGQIMTATAILNSNATGYVNFTVNGLSQIAEIEDGIAVWNFTGLSVGRYNLTARYLGDNYYLSSSNSTSFNISKANSTISIYVGDVYLYENIRIHANLSSNATGAVTFSMLGYYTPRDKPIVDSHAVWYISPLNTGSYTIIAEYKGDDNYFGSNSSYILKIQQRQSFLNVEIDDVGLNQDPIAKVSLKTKHNEGINGTVILTIGNRVYSIKTVNGTANYNLGRFDEGNYNFTAIYEGNEDFAMASQNGSFIASDEIFHVYLSADDLVKYYGGAEKLLILANLMGNAFAGAKINVLIGNQNYQIMTDNEGKAVLDLNLESGTYEAVITLDDSKYFASSIKANVIVKSTVEAFDMVKAYGSSTQYHAIFTDSLGKLLSNRDVTIKVGSNAFTVRTLENGIAILDIGLNVGTYQITAINPLTGETKTTNLIVFKYLAENKDSSGFCNYKQTYKVRAYNDNGQPASGVTVRIKVNSKTYKVKTDRNGYAKLSLKLKPGSYTIKATYKGFTVTNRMTVKHVLKAKNIKAKRTAKRIRIKVSLKKVKGKYLKNKKITLKFNKKTFKVKTNKKGIATFTIRWNVYKKLKAGKKYQYKVIWGKDSLKKTIRFRK